MVAYLQATEHEKRSAERDIYSVKQLRRFFSGRMLDEITPQEARGYVAARKTEGAAHATIKKELGLLSSAINYARREWGWDAANPVQGLRLKVPEGRIRWITRAEAVALLRAAGQDARAKQWLPDFIRLGLHTGMRRGEMLGLEWRRVDLQEGLIYLEASHQKNGKHGSVPLNREARETIVARARFRAKYCPASPWVFCDRKGNRIQSVKHSFATACERAGIEDFHIHDLRHTCAAWLVQAGVPIPEIMHLLRHSDIRMTMRYAHLAPENVRSAVTRLEGLLSRSGHVETVTDRKEDEMEKLTA